MNHILSRINNYLYLIPVLLFALTLPYKFTGNALPYLVAFFDGLTSGHGQQVMVFIGLQEVLLIVLLLGKKTRKLGLLGAFLLMIGAIFTHLFLAEYDLVFVQAIVIALVCAYKLEPKLV